LADVKIDQGSGLLNPHYDPDTGVVLLWGKGETSIKFFELTDTAPFAHHLTDYQTTIPQVGVAVLPKTACNVREVEIFKVYKLTQDTIEPTGFRVPRQRVRTKQLLPTRKTLKYLVPAERVLSRRYSSSHCR